MTEGPRQERLVFGEVAETYDRARPGYPPQLVDDVLALAATPAGGRALEVGAGTGKATVLFAERGVDITCLEPSTEMAAVVRRNCERFPDVRIVVTGLEDWAVDREDYHLLFSAQAWHWITESIKYRKARAALAPHGLLALFWNHPIWKRSELREALDDVYQRLAPEDLVKGAGFGGRKPRRAREDWIAEINDSGFFGEVDMRTYPWTQTYPTERYLELLTTHSDHRMLPEDDRRRLLDEVRRVVHAAGGAVSIDYVTELYLARRLD